MYIHINMCTDIDIHGSGFEVLSRSPSRSPSRCTVKLSFFMWFFSLWISTSYCLGFQALGVVGTLVSMFGGAAAAISKIASITVRKRRNSM